MHYSFLSNLSTALSVGNTCIFTNFAQKPPTTLHCFKAPDAIDLDFILSNTKVLYISGLTRQFSKFHNSFSEIVAWTADGIDVRMSGNIFLLF